MWFRWIGFAGTALVVVAYLPQIVHLVRAKCTAGVSVWAYSTWTTSALALLAYAISQRDPVFISLQSYQLLATLSIFLLSLRHKGRLCAEHCGEMPA